MIDDGTAVRFSHLRHLNKAIHFSIYPVTQLRELGSFSIDCLSKCGECRQRSKLCLLSPNSQSVKRTNQRGHLSMSLSIRAVFTDRRLFSPAEYKGSATITLIVSFDTHQAPSSSTSTRYYFKSTWSKASIGIERTRDVCDRSSRDHGK